MEVWLAIDGEKKGPFRDFEVRGRIRRGELDGGVHAWYQGLPEWTPLEETPAFGNEFTRPAEEELREEPEAALETAPPPPPLPEKPAYGRRFWARWVDVHIYLAFWWLAMWALGRPIGPAMDSLVVALVQLLPWALLEAALIARYGVTPGKWLMGLRVENADGTRLNPGASLLRALRVLITGIGFGIGPLAILCQIFSVIAIRRFRRPLWDHMANHEVRAAPLRPLRVFAAALALYLSLQAQIAVTGPYLIEKMGVQFPALKEMWEKAPPTTLPQRDQ